MLPASALRPSRVRSRLAVGVLSALALAGPWRITPTFAGEGPPAPGPNVLIIVTDDQRASGTVIPAVMPATLSWFRGGGTRFPRAVATTPLCCPARSTLMTGRYAHNHGVRMNADGGVLDHDTTLQAYLDEAGYRTGIFGKLLNTWPIEEDPPHWDEWATFRGGYYREMWNVGGDLGQVSRYSTHFIADGASEFLEDTERNDQEPWYLYVAPYAPHMSATAAPEHQDAPVPKWFGNPATRERDRTDKPPYVQAEDRGTAFDTRRRQLRSLMSVDDLVSKLSTRLRELGEQRDTLAIFLSDNGFMWGEHGWRAKNAPYAQSLKIPMLVRWPGGGVEAGARDDRLVGNVDIAPTVLDAAGIPASDDPPMDGRSLLDPTWRRDLILAEGWGNSSHPLLPPWGSLLTPTEQYVEYYGDQIGVSFREWYGLVEDPWQLDNAFHDSKSSNDPGAMDIADLALELDAARRCRGTTGLWACP